MGSKIAYVSKVEDFDKKKLYSVYKPWKEHCDKNKEKKFTIYKNKKKKILPYVTLKSLQMIENVIECP